MTCLEVGSLYGVVSAETLNIWAHLIVVVRQDALRTCAIGPTCPRVIPATSVNVSPAVNGKKLVEVFLVGDNHEESRVHRWEACSFDIHFVVIHSRCGIWRSCCLQQFIKRPQDDHIGIHDHSTIIFFPGSTIVFELLKFAEYAF